jgi:hypothetical protein
MSFAVELEARAQRQKLRRLASQNSLTPAKKKIEDGQKKPGALGGGGNDDGDDDDEEEEEEDEEANDVLDLLNDSRGVDSPGPLDEDSIFLRMGGAESDGNETDDSDVSSVMSIDPVHPLKVPGTVATKGGKGVGNEPRKPSPLASQPSTSASTAPLPPAPKGATRDLRRNKSLQGVNFDSPGDFQDKRLRKEQHKVVQGQHAIRANARSTKYDAQQQLAIQFIRRKEQACAWIEQASAKSPSKRREKTVLPTVDRFAAALKSGIVLCELMQVINGERAETMVIHRQYPPATREMRERDNLGAFVAQCLDVGVDQGAIFDVDDLYEASDTEGGGNLGAVLYTLGALARVAAHAGLLEDSLFWKGPGFKTPQGTLYVDQRTREYTQEEVTKASVALLMMDGDAATPILNFTDKIGAMKGGGKGNENVDKAGGGRGAAGGGRTRAVSSDDDDFGQTSSDEEDDRAARSGTRNRASIGESVNMGDLKESKEQFQKRLNLVKRKLIVTQTRVSIGSANEVPVGEQGGDGESPRRRRSLTSQQIRAGPNSSKDGGYTSGDEMPGRAGMYGAAASNLVVGENNEVTLSGAMYARAPSSPAKGGGRPAPTATAMGGARSPQKNGMPAIAAWLTSLGLAEYIPNFDEEGWDNPSTVKKMLTEHELTRMGITKRGHVLRILATVPKLGSHAFGEGAQGPGLPMGDDGGAAGPHTPTSTVQTLPADLAVRWNDIKRSVQGAIAAASSEGNEDEGAAMECIDGVLKATENLLIPKKVGNRPVVLDIGWHCIRAGFAGADRPEIVVPSVKGFVKPIFQESIGAKGAQRQADGGREDSRHVLHGREADEKAEICMVRQPLRRGIDEIACPQHVEWSDLSDLIGHTFERLGVDPTNHAVVLIESWPNRPVEDREKLIKILFDTFVVPSISILPQGPLVLASYGLTTGLVVDIGESFSRAMPVFDGKVIPSASTRSPIAGRELTEQTMRMLTFDGFNFGSFANAVRSDGVLPGSVWLQKRAAASLKENLIYASRRVDLSHPLHKSVDATSLPLHLQPTLNVSSNAEFVNWGIHRCEVTECMFNPGLIRGDQYYLQGSLQGTIESSVRLLPAPLQRTMFSYIFLTGGTSECPGLPKRLFSELKSSVRMDVRVIAPASRKHAAWRGGAILASRHDFEEVLTVSRGTYQESGVGFVLEQLMRISGDDAGENVGEGDSPQRRQGEGDQSCSPLQQLLRSTVKTVINANELERHDKITATIESLSKMTQAFTESVKAAAEARRQVAQLTDQLESSRSKWAAADKVRCKAAASACKARLKRAEKATAAMKKELMEQKQMMEMMKEKDLF